MSRPGAAVSSELEWQTASSRSIYLAACSSAAGSLKTNGFKNQTKRANPEADFYNFFEKS